MSLRDLWCRLVAPIDVRFRVAIDQHCKNLHARDGIQRWYRDLHCRRRGDTSGYDDELDCMDTVELPMPSPWVTES